MGSSCMVTTTRWSHRAIQGLKPNDTNFTPCHWGGELGVLGGKGMDGALMAAISPPTSPPHRSGDALCVPTQLQMAPLEQIWLLGEKRVNTPAHMPGSLQVRSSLSANGVITAHTRNTISINALGRLCQQGLPANPGDFWCLLFSITAGNLKLQQDNLPPQLATMAPRGEMRGLQFLGIWPQRLQVGWTGLPSSVST